VAHAAVSDRRAARKHRISQRAVDGSRELGAPRPAHAAKESLQDAEVRVARRLQRNPLIAQPDAAGDAQARQVADEPWT